MGFLPAGHITSYMHTRSYWYKFSFMPIYGLAKAQFKSQHHQPDVVYIHSNYKTDFEQSRHRYKAMDIAIFSSRRTKLSAFPFA